MKASFARVILFAFDVQALSRFYQEALGLTLLESEHPPEEWAALDAGGMQLALHDIPSPWRENIEIADPPDVRHGSPHKPVFVVADLKAACAELEAKNVPRVGPPSEPGEELMRCDFADPEGNVFQLTSA